MAKKNKAKARTFTNEPYRFGSEVIPPGERRHVQIPLARLPSETWLHLPAEVVNGAHAGPRLWLSAAIHGDELNGVEVIREVLNKIDAEEMHGVLVAVPIVNVFGFLNQSRYLPDRRDLNRSFPGSAGGSLAARIAHIFMSEVVSKCTHGIDLHTGSNHRTNLPQIRANLNHSETRRCAEAFGAPVIMHAEMRDGSLRQAANKLKVPVLVYEAGEPLRFEENAIQTGVQGTLRMMAALGMLPKDQTPPPPPKPSTVVQKSTWVRARRGGIFRLETKLGQHVTRRQVLAHIADAFGRDAKKVRAPQDGIIIGHTNNPLANQGDGLFNLAIETTAAAPPVEEIPRDAATTPAIT